MSFRNTLCVDNRCNSNAGCAHRGKLGSYCDFSTEQKLCGILNLHWHPGLELDMLISLIQDKIAMLPGPEDYDGQVKLATSKTSLTAIEESKDGLS